MAVLIIDIMTLCHNNIEDGFSKMPPNHTAMVWKSPGSFYLFFGLGLTGTPLQASKV